MKKYDLLPKSLFSFYFSNGIKPFKFVFMTWFALFFIRYIGYNILFPLFTKWFIELFEQPVPIGETFLQFAFPTIVVILVASLLINTVNVFNYTIQDKYIRILIPNKLSEILYGYTWNQSIDYLKNRFPGKISAQIENITNGFSEIFASIFRLVMFIVTFVIIAVMLAQINAVISVIILSVIVINLGWTFLTMKSMNAASAEHSEKKAHLLGKLIDSISNYVVIKMFAGEKYEADYISIDRENSMQAGRDSYFRQRVSWVPPVFVSYSFGTVAIMIMCVYLYATGAIKVSEIVFALSVYASLIDSMDYIIDLMPPFFDSLGGAQQSYNELNRPIAVTDAPNAKALAIKRGKIEFKNLSFKFHKRPVLENVNIVVRPGEKLGIVGVSGAGKTTLINLLMRFFDPNEGQILIDGQDIKSITQDSLRENIAFIPQEPTMFNRSLRDNIGYGLKDATFAQIKAAARNADAHKFIMESPDKYNSLVGDRGIKLSGGQRQRIAIARAFLKNAPILILDEATAALDSETEMVVQKSFKELSAGRTTIAIAHRLSTLRNMDRIIVLDKGHIVEDGTHEKLMCKKNGIYARLWHMQSDGFIQI